MLRESIVFDGFWRVLVGCRRATWSRTIRIRPGCVLAKSMIVFADVRSVIRTVFGLGHPNVLNRDLEEANMPSSYGGVVAVDHGVRGEEAPDRRQ
jgi:hypothetical protein